MSPITTKVIHKPKGFPRVSGDEPTDPDWVKEARGFSPRERG